MATVGFFLSGVVVFLGYLRQTPKPHIHECEALGALLVVGTFYLRLWFSNDTAKPAVIPTGGVV